MKLIFSDRAISDLEQIGCYISKNSPETARRHVQKLINRARLAARFPKSGRVVPEYQEDNLRELIEGNYRIVFEIHKKKKTVTIITIFESHHQI